jgi:hypothetical protein
LVPLLWWFIQRSLITPAAESTLTSSLRTVPVLVPPPRPPPAWGSVRASSPIIRLSTNYNMFRSVLWLSFVSNVLGSPSEVLTSPTWVPPCPVSVIFILLLFPPWVLLYLQSKWPALSAVLTPENVKFWLRICLLYPSIFVSFWWWFATFNKLVFSNWWWWIKLCSFIPFGIVGYYCSSWCLCFLSRLLVFGSSSFHTFLSLPTILRSTPTQQHSVGTRRPSVTPIAVTSSSLASFTRWCFVQSTLCLCIVWWILSVVRWNLRSYFLLPIILPCVGLFLTPAPHLPRPRRRQQNPPSFTSMELLDWLLGPSLVGIMILSWISFVHSLGLHTWIAFLLLGPVICFLLGGVSCILWYWVTRLSDLMFASPHPRPTRLSLLPCLYDGVWVVAPPRRKRRTTPFGWHFRVSGTPSAPSVSHTLRHVSLLLLLGTLRFAFIDLPQRDPTKLPVSPRPPPLPGEQTLTDAPSSSRAHSKRLVQSYSHDYLTVLHWSQTFLHYAVVQPYHYHIIQSPCPCPWSDSLSTPHWPAPLFDHLLGSSHLLPYEVSYHHSVDSSAACYDIDVDVNQSGDGSFTLVEDASDTHAYNLIEFTNDYLSLQAAGYRFTFMFEPTESVPVSKEHLLSWRQYEQKLSALHAASQPISWSSLATSFLAPFSPAEAARAIIRPWMYNVSEGRVTVSLARRFARVYPILSYNVKLQHIPLIVDSGASVCITPCKSDFKPGTYRSSNMKVRDLSSENKVDGEGLVQWAVKDTNGNTHVIELPCLHIASAGVHLLSPQVLNKRHHVSGSIEDDGIHLHAASTEIIARYNPVSNLPELQLTDLPTASSVWTDAFEDVSLALRSPSSPLAFLNVVDDDNKNLSPAEKELALASTSLSHQPSESSPVMQEASMGPCLPCCSRLVQHRRHSSHQI